MAHCVAVADGNLTTAATWGVVDVGATSVNVSNSTGSTALTTGNLDSGTFTPAANALIGVVVKLAARAAGSPSNTMTVTLRNSTAGTNAQSVTVNVSDLPAATSGANSEGGWHYLRFAASHTPNGTDLYLIRATLSSTSTAVSLATNGTANNWQRMLVRSTTAAPGTGDDMHIPQDFNGANNPATLTARAVTMNSVAATDYGSADTVNTVAALDISKGSSLTWGTTAATNYILRLSGHFKVYSGGTHTLGAMPRDSTAVLEFDCAADWAFYYSGMNGSASVIQGLSRTSGKNVSQCLLTATVNAAATTLNVDTDTGWLNGDAVAVGATTRTRTHADQVALTAGAGASSLTVGAVTNSHPYSATEQVVGEVVLLSRNVIIRSTSSTAMSGFVLRPTASADCDWVLFQYCGATGGQGDHGIILETTTGVVSFHHCAMRDLDEGGVTLTGTVASPGSVTIDSLSIYRHAVATSSYGVRLAINPAAAGLVTISNVWVILAVTSTAYGLSAEGVYNIAFSGEFRMAGNGDTGLHITGNYQGLAFGGNWHCHSGAGEGIYSDAAWSNCRMTGTLRLWRNGDSGLNIGANALCLYFVDVYCFGNTSQGIFGAFGFIFVDVRFRYLLLAGDTSFAQAQGMQWRASVSRLLVERGDFGVATGIYVAHVNEDLEYEVFFEARFPGCVFGSTTERTPTLPTVAANLLGSCLRFQGEDGTAGNDFTQTSVGTVARDTTTVQDSPGLICTPSSATLKLESNAGQRGFGFMVGVLSGNTVQVAVSARKNGAYNGNAPRLVLKSNAAAGFNVDVVLDTLTVGADTWETLTGTTGAATATGVLEFVVDGDGTAGSFFVNQWASGTATPGGDETFWHDGLALRADAVGATTDPPIEPAFGYVG